MKKRLISVLLTVLIVAGLFSGLTVSAAADDTIKHTLKSGETVSGVCAALGIDFYANYDWITKTNNIKSYNNLKPGLVLTLPAPGTKPGTGGTSSTPGNMGGSAGSSASTTTELQGNDYASGYLINHTLQYGETVSGVCVALGIDFYANSDLILKLNNLKGYNNIIAGRKLLLPSPKAPASGSCIMIVAHKVVSGDATYNICESYGIDYTKNLDLMKILNNRDNMAAIKVNQTIYIPVPTTIKANTGGGNTGGSGGNTGGSGGNTGGGNTGSGDTGSSADGKTYSIYQNTTNHGSYQVLVDGKSASQAKSGAVVTISTDPDDYYKLGNITVTNDGKEVATVKDGKFTMPNCNVRISVSFVSAEDYAINKARVSNGSFKTTVNGTEVDKAAAGQTVKVQASPAYGYELDSISVSYSKGGAAVSVSNGSFVMPAGPVNVSVTFKKAEPHYISKETVTGGSFETQINGVAVDKAESGETVKIVASPGKGFKLASVSVVRNDGVTVAVNNNSFVMPETSVTVKVTFKAEIYTVFTDSADNGKFSIEVNGKTDTSAAYGDTVKVLVYPDSGYVLDSVKITKDGQEVAKLDSAGCFTMPDKNVRVTVSFKKA